MEKLLGESLYRAVTAGNDGICEIRLRVNRPVIVKTKSKSIEIERYIEERELEEILGRVTEGSLYAYEDQLSKGYVEYGSGMRIGVCGEFRHGNGKIVLRKIHSLCIRIPHEVIGCAARFIRENFENTLIVSPPAGGKTTLIRDYTRLLANRYDVLVIDERYELAGSDCRMNVGKRSDLLQGVEKSAVYETAVRTMAPQIVVCDELFGEKDFNAVSRLSISGIKVLATYHADRWIPDRLRTLFRRRIYLSPYPSFGTVVAVEED